MRGPGLSRTLVVLTLVLATLVAATSLLGLLTAWPYAAETASWRVQGRGQDIGNLPAVVVAVAAAAMARRGSRRAFEIWLGTLLYLAYAFAIYSFAVHFGRLFLAYVLAFGLSVWCLIFGLTSRGATTPDGSRRTGGWVITGIAILFALVWLGSIVPATLAGQASADLVETGLPSNPVHVLDLALVLPGMAITALLARRGAPTARLLVVPWLVFSTLMGASIVATMVMTGSPVPVLVAIGAVTLTSAVVAVIELRDPSSAALDAVRETLRVA